MWSLPAGLTQRFKDVEEEVFNALRHLIADTSVLKQYAAASLIVYKVWPGCMLATHSS